MPSLFSVSRATSTVLSAASSFGGSTSTVVFAIAVNLIGPIREKSSLTTLWTRQPKFCGKTAIVCSYAQSTSPRIKNYRYWNIWKTSRSEQFEFRNGCEHGSAQSFSGPCCSRSSFRQGLFSNHIRILWTRIPNRTGLM